MTPLTKEQVAEIRKRAEAATEGPYSVIEGAEYIYADSFILDGVPGSLGFIDSPFLPPERNEANRQFLSHARTDITDLCATVEYMYQENDALLRKLVLYGDEYEKVEKQLERAQAKIEELIGHTG